MIKKILIIIFISLLLILYIVSEMNKSKVLNWQLNFSGISKDPYGCYVFRKTLEDHTGINFSKTTNGTFYNIIPKIKNKKGSTLLVITDNFSPDSINLIAAYHFVSRGNNMFISSYSFEKRFKDSLKFDVDYFNLSSFGANADTINFVNPALQSPKSFAFDGMNSSEFSKIDTMHHWVLGNNNAGGINYIRVPYGKGAFYLHSQPLVFSNYHILYSHKEYPYNALSYFKNTSLVWDDYYKPKVGRYTLEDQTPFRYFLSQDALRIALYLTLILIAIYFFIESKRKQRFVPILTPLENSTVKFVSTVARLYQGQPDYKKMAGKKFLYLKELVYSRYLLRLDENNPATAIQFSEKTGFSLEQIKELYIIYRRIESSISINADVLISFSKQVDDFYEFEKEK